MAAYGSMYNAGVMEENGMAVAPFWLWNDEHSSLAQLWAGATQLRYVSGMFPTECWRERLRVMGNLQLRRSVGSWL